MMTSGLSQSTSSILQQSPDDIPPIDPQAVIELENHARHVADSLDLMMTNLRSNLHKVLLYIYVYISLCKHGHFVSIFY